ncbi:NAD(P)H-dependent oxidoreductase subunit E [Dehalobacter sp. DCM]|uniref:NADH-quinone oxidoreductase subunit NuoE family protein n=1 Tax=Dehalobacter sp. DCM TaxID=2907827 RepID=UPI003081AAA3|nr:NAD(P)H-dependent oxidoreductase subunit E [Dehalobacter sp. DCM]
MSSEVKGCQCCCDAKENDRELFDRIGEIIEKYRDREGSLIQVLHMAQNIYGYLPLELQKYIAERMDKPLSEVSGVITFYSFFSTQPKGKHTIRVCLGTACYVRGGKKIVDKLIEILGVEIGDTTPDGIFTLEVMRCIGACGLAPAMMIDDVVYKQVNPNKLQQILNKYYR